MPFSLIIVTARFVIENATTYVVMTAHATMGLVRQKLKRSRQIILLAFERREV